MREVRNEARYVDTSVLRVNITNLRETNGCVMTNPRSACSQVYTQKRACRDGVNIASFRQSIANSTVSDIGSAVILEADSPSPQSEVKSGFAFTARPSSPPRWHLAAAMCLLNNRRFGWKALSVHRESPMYGSTKVTSY